MADKYSYCKTAISRIVSKSFDEVSIKADIENYQGDWFKDLLEYAETYPSGHSMRYTIMRDVMSNYFKSIK